MKITLGIPAMDSHELTAQCVASILKTIENPALFRIVVIDNGSSVPYLKKNQFPYTVDIIRNDQNRGYYYPLQQLYNSYGDDLLALVHNDVLFYQKGWDDMLRQAFVTDRSLGLVGLCGSDEIDHLGGRGGGTMCNFNGTYGQLQEHTGRKVTDIKPALLLDSLFMIFRRQVVPTLQITDDITLCHFHDKLWSLKTYANGYHVAVAGIEIDHWGGRTACESRQYVEDAKNWAVANKIETSDPLHTQYQVGEQAFLAYAKERGYLPNLGRITRIFSDYQIKQL